jgi:hypothetical protein
LIEKNLRNTTLEEHTPVADEESVDEVAGRCFLQNSKKKMEETLNFVFNLFLVVIMFGVMVGVLLFVYRMIKDTINDE